MISEFETLRDLVGNPIRLECLRKRLYGKQHPRPTTIKKQLVSKRVDFCTGDRCKKRHVFKKGRFLYRWPVQKTACFQKGSFSAPVAGAKNACFRTVPKNVHQKNPFPVQIFALKYRQKKGPSILYLVAQNDPMVYFLNLGITIACLCL